MKMIRTAKWGYILFSLMFCITGLLLMVNPEFSKRVLCCCIGVLLILYGIIKIIGYFSKDLYCLAFQFDLALGLLFFLTGIVMLIYYEKILVVFNFIIGFITFTDGSFKLQTGMDAKRFGLSKWWMIIAISIFVCALGLYLIIDPLEIRYLSMLMTGAAFFMEGILNMSVAFYTVKVIKRKKEDINRV